MIVGYAVPDKAKSRNLVDAFCEGAKGRRALDIGVLHPGDVAFYGVTEALAHIWRQARKQGRNWWAMDNAYIDVCREQFFRLSVNRWQHFGTGQGSPVRLQRVIDLYKATTKPFEIRTWRRSGSYILLVPQSDKFMSLNAERPGNWVADTTKILRQYTDREIRVKPWQRDKARFYEAFPAAVKDAWAVVTWSSASAQSATFLGVPAFVTATDCIARPWCNTDLAKIESPAPEVDRWAFAAMLAKWQFTINELRSGLAYRTCMEECWNDQGMVLDPRETGRPHAGEPVEGARPVVAESPRQASA